MKYRTDKLTSIEKQVMNFVIRGLSNDEIVNRMFIEKSTLKTHLAHIYKKFDITETRTDTIRCYEHTSKRLKAALIFLEDMGMLNDRYYRQIKDDNDEV